MQKLLVLVGPTASGKTDLSIQVAKALDAEIISGDSMQIYQGMAISTAQPSPEEMAGVVHYGIADRPPAEAYSAAQFQAAARQRIADIGQRGKVPFVVGGTGLYINGLIYDYQYADTDRQGRLLAEQKVQELGLAEVVSFLLERAPDLLDHVEKRDPRRVTRALELYYLKQQDFLEKDMLAKYQQHAYDLTFFGLTMDRKRLYERINQRVDLMVDQGLLAEVEALLKQDLPADTPALRAIGVKEFIPYFQGNTPLERAISEVKKNTRRFAKRQLTWFRRDPNLTWLNLDVLSKAEAAEKIIRTFQGKTK